MLSELIHNALSCVEGQPIRNIGRAGNMVWIGFGVDTISNNYKGSERVLPKYAVHIQGAFRVTCFDKILFGSNDIYTPASNVLKSNDSDWDKTGTSYFDERATELSVAFQSNEVLVVKIEGTSYGDLTIMLSNNIGIEIFNNSGTESECWRFIEPGNVKTQFIITGQGVST